MGDRLTTVDDAGCEDARVDRRSFLGLLTAAGLVGLSGCTSTTPGPTPTGTGAGPAPLPTDDDELRRITADAELQLIALYATAIAAADPALAEQLRTLQEQHVAHAQRLVPGEPVSLDATASAGAEQPDPGASPAPSTSAARPDPTATASPSPRAVLVSLRRAELAALDQRRGACVQASGPDLVRSLCLIAASEAQHADVLAALRAEIPR